jgi:tetratricopeptide (TPR) repeat protein
MKHFIQFICILNAAVLIGGCASKPQPVTLNTPASQLTQQQISTKNAAVDLLAESERLYAQADWSGAQQALEKLVQQNAKNAYFWFKLGNVHAQLGQYENAAQAYHSAIAVDPNNVAAAYNMGLMRLAQAQAAFELAQSKAASASSQQQQLRSLTENTGKLLQMASFSAEPELKRSIPGK